MNAGQEVFKGTVQEIQEKQARDKASEQLTQAVRQGRDNINAIPVYA